MNGPDDDLNDFLVDIVILLAFGSFVCVTLYGLMMFVIAFWQVFLFAAAAIVLSAFILGLIKP